MFEYRIKPIVEKLYSCSVLQIERAHVCSRFETLGSLRSGCKMMVPGSTSSALVVVVTATVAVAVAVAFADCFN